MKYTILWNRVWITASNGSPNAIITHHILNVIKLQIIPAQILKTKLVVFCVNCYHQCGRPTTVSTCKDCGLPIGGTSHQLIGGSNIQTTM